MRVAEAVMSAIIIGTITAFIGLFLHVQELDASVRNAEDKFNYIQNELKYIRGKVDKLYEINQ